MKKALLWGACLLALSQTASVQTALAQDAAAQDDRRAAFREKIQERLAATDTNSDGNIDKAEFMAKAEEKFAKIDVDADGVITSEEMKAVKGRFQGGQGGGVQFP